jgi:hypothetical protein
LKTLFGIPDRPRVLVACEFSGTVRDAFRALGWNAWSCDLLPTEKPGNHYRGDVLSILNEHWDLLIGHPPCKFLCSSGLHWNNRGRGWADTWAALRFFQRLWSAPCDHIALENSIGILSDHVGPPDQTVQPYEFGHDASKGTCLWLKGLPQLKPTAFVAPTRVGGRNVWGNQTLSGQNALPPSLSRDKDRARTYEGIALAMATQWTQYLLDHGKLILPLGGFPEHDTPLPFQV